MAALVGRVTFECSQFIGTLASPSFFLLQLALLYFNFSSWTSAALSLCQTGLLMGVVLFANKIYFNTPSACQPEPGCAVLITGASSGFGRMAAVRFVRRGVLVFACVRRQEDADSLRDEVSGGADATRSAELQHLVPLLMDVTSQQQVSLCVERVKQLLAQRGARLKVLINNAGYGQFGNLDELRLDLFHKQFEVNVTGALRVTQAFLPLLREAGALARAAERASARIVFVSSLCGRLVVPGQTAYCASKFALEAMADGLRVELPRAQHVDVVVIQPGVFATRFIENGGSAADPASSSAQGFVRHADALGRVAPSADPVIDVYWHASFDRHVPARWRVGWDAMIGLPLMLWLPDRVRDALWRLVTARRASAH